MNENPPVSVRWEVQRAARAIRQGDYSEARSELRGITSLSVAEYRALKRASEHAKQNYGAPVIDPLDFRSNPTGGMSLAAGLVLTAAAVGALVFFTTRKSKAATPTLPPAKCTPTSEQELEAFGKAFGYTVFYDDQSVELGNKPPANPNYVNNPKAREYLVNSCSFFMWTGTTWVVDTKTNAELESWRAAMRRGPIYTPSLSGAFVVLR